MPVKLSWLLTSRSPADTDEHSCCIAVWRLAAALVPFIHQFAAAAAAAAAAHNICGEGACSDESTSAFPDLWWLLSVVLFHLCSAMAAVGSNATGSSSFDSLSPWGVVFQVITSILRHARKQQGQEQQQQQQQQEQGTGWPAGG